MAEATRNSSSAAVKAARKKKIRQLEASLFGGGGGGGSDVTTGLPDLKTVDEYNSTFNTAERRSKTSSSGSGLPALKKAPAERRNLFAAAKNRFGSIAGPRPTSRSDEEELLESSDESATPDFNPPPVPPPPLNPPPPTAQRDPARRGSFGGGVLRSEVEQLDDSIRHLVKDPKREVLENLKRRHGVTKSPSMHDGIYTFPKQGSLTNVAAAAQAPLDRATLLERRRSLVDTPGSAGRRRAASLDRTSRLLEQEQADLERTMRKVDPRFGKVEGAAPLSAQTDGGQAEFSWPSMPVIKPAAIAIGGKKDSLQPIGSGGGAAARNRSRSPRHSMSSPVIPSSPLSPTSAGPLEDKFGRASKLPAIGGKVPDIKINTSHRPRRDPNDETRAPPSPGSLREPKPSPSPSPKASMVNFEGLERIKSGERGESLSDYENFSEDVPTNTLDDMPKGTFDDIPTTVFDAIPTAVVERERKRTILRSSKAAKAAGAGGGGTNSRGGSVARGSEQAALVSPSADAASFSSAAADLFMSGRVESEEVMLSNSSAAPSAPPLRHHVDVGAVSLITALFPNAAAAAAAAAADAARREDGDQVNSDFVFALFIQEQEQAGLQVNP